MDCQTARRVWNHPNGFIEGVKEAFPGVLEHLENHVAAFVNNETNPFQDSVRHITNLRSGYYIDHSDTEDDPLCIGTHEIVGDAAGKIALEKHFSSQFNTPIVIGNVCCSACIIMPEPLPDEDMLAIQRAAVNLAPNGQVHE